jgi:hypothetical protein
MCFAISLLSGCPRLRRLSNAATRVLGVPQNDGRDQQVEAGGTEHLVLEAPVAQFTKPIEEQRASECVTSFAFVQAGMGASPQIEIADPVEPACARSGQVLVRRVTGCYRDRLLQACAV